MCGSSKYPYPAHKGKLEILRGWGSQKFLKNLKQEFDAQLEVPGGGC